MSSPCLPIGHFVKKNKPFQFSSLKFGLIQLRRCVRNLTCPLWVLPTYLINWFMFFSFTFFKLILKLVSLGKPERTVIGLRHLPPAPLKLRPYGYKLQQPWRDTGLNKQVSKYVFM